jgi:hypothetical protein
MGIELKTLIEDACRQFERNSQREIWRGSLAIMIIQMS